LLEEQVSEAEQSQALAVRIGRVVTSLVGVPGGVVLAQHLVALTDGAERGRALTCGAGGGRRGVERTMTVRDRLVGVPEVQVRGGDPVQRAGDPFWPSAFDSVERAELAGEGLLEQADLVVAPAQSVERVRLPALVPEVPTEVQFELGVAQRLAVGRHAE